MIPLELCRRGVACTRTPQPAPRCPRARAAEAGLGVSRAEDGPSRDQGPRRRRARGPRAPATGGPAALRRAAEDVAADSEALGAAGVASALLVLWSEATLQATGRGLPEGPFGLLGALEGLAYLAVIGLVAWSALTKVTTGSGLPGGRLGLRGAAEGLSYLAFGLGLVLLWLQVTEVGYLDFAPFPLRIEFKK
ncbi:unnamed protein product [Prorocentrum cordatum]|uniref:Uncharacterized protein n=1 Tax=Prorocentrum cordatum TaxID=2364126 RepID=A0ABN9TCM9_9DINO|nr:unnamed protein product [Polarella glacialis]